MSTDKIVPENVNVSKLDLVQNTKKNYKLNVFNGCMNLVAHLLIGATVGVSILFSFTYDFDYFGTKVHIIICVLGYQLLMAEAILSLSPHNSWTSTLKYAHKRRIHWVLQITGSAMAIVGSFIKMMDKTVHWDTLHAQFSLVALVFTTVCLVNGLTSLFAYELRRVIPGTLSKVTHICFGTIAFSASAVCLCYGFDKPSFNRWATPPLKATFMAFVGIFTVIVIVNPVINFVDKSVKSLKRICVRIFMGVYFLKQFYNMLVIVMHSGSTYCRMVTSAILIGLCHILIGATLMPVLMYSMIREFEDKHVPLYVFGFHFFSAEAILFLNYSNGLATPMRLRHRRCAHAILQACAVICIIAGSIFVYNDRGASGSNHGITGVAAAILAGCSLLSFPCAVYGKGNRKLVHIVIGIPTFLMSSISLCLGFFTTKFKAWAGDELVYILTAFVISYTTIILVKVTLKFW